MIALVVVLLMGPNDGAMACESTATRSDCTNVTTRDPRWAAQVWVVKKTSSGPVDPRSLTKIRDAISNIYVDMATKERWRRDRTERIYGRGPWATFVSIFLNDDGSLMEVQIESLGTVGASATRGSLKGLRGSNDPGLRTPDYLNHVAVESIRKAEPFNM